MAVTDWRSSAACRGYSPDMFHRELGSRRGRPDAWANWAKTVCAACPVRAECLTEELLVEASTIAFVRTDEHSKSAIWTFTPIPQGVYGGFTASERHARPIKHLESCRGKCGGCRPVEDRVRILLNEESVAC